MKTTDAFTQGFRLISTILSKMPDLNKWRRRFVVETMMLFLTIKGRINFLQLGRFGKYNESTYRLGFEKGFDFFEFNKHLVMSYCSEDRILGFDPSYISKSGKGTPGLGYFYSGTAGRHKRGLEIAGIAVIDLQHNTAYHVEAIQTPSAQKTKLSDGQSLVDHYGELIVERGEQLLSISTKLVVDAYFAKRKFIDPVCEFTDLDIICRLRDDANLRYLFQGDRTKGKGRPKQYAGKINVNKIDKRRIPLEYECEDYRIYSAVVNSVGLKRNIKLAYVEFINSGKIVTTKLFFSTHLNMNGFDILRYYRARYQMEFNFRDSKQYTGLENCQARSSNKLHFHINMALTSVSVAKCIQREGLDRSTSIHHSVSDIKTELCNRMLLNRIFSIYQITPNIKLNGNMYRSILNFGKIAA